MRMTDPTDPNDSGEYDPSPRTPRPSPTALPPVPTAPPVIVVPENEPKSRFFKIAAAFVLIALGIIYIGSR